MVGFGAALAAGGTWLVASGGSFYYMLVGVGLIVSGYLLGQRRAEGAWIYLLAFLLTLVWTWWEVGANRWDLFARILGPALLLICVIAITPTLRTYRHDYEAAATIAVGLLLLIGAILVLVGPFGKPNAEAGAALPPPGMKMEEPSPQRADWPSYGGGYRARRYSPLDRINCERGIEQSLGVPIADIVRMRLVAIGEAIEHGAYRGRRAEEECTGSGTLQGRNRSRAQDRKACSVRRHLASCLRAAHKAHGHARALAAVHPGRAAALLSVSPNLGKNITRRCDVPGPAAAYPSCRPPFVRGHRGQPPDGGTPSPSPSSR
ncbi:hypothetical protein V1279_006497 [Bradyrhizobium sp. AZCC 1610]